MASPSLIRSILLMDWREILFSILVLYPFYAGGGLDS
jgi:hypothetical protein